MRMNREQYRWSPLVAKPATSLTMNTLKKGIGTLTITERDRDMATDRAILETHGPIGVTTEGVITDTAADPAADLRNRIDSTAIRCMATDLEAMDTASS